MTILNIAITIADKEFKIIEWTSKMFTICKFNKSFSLFLAKWGGEYENCITIMQFILWKSKNAIPYEYICDVALIDIQWSHKIVEFYSLFWVSVYYTIKRKYGNKTNTKTSTG